MSTPTSEGMPGFVEVLDERTGKTQMVPEHFLSDAKLSAGLTRVEPDVVLAALAAEVSEVQLVAGTVADVSLVPAAREAAEHEAAAAAVVLEVPTDRSSHAEIDAYAAAQIPPIDLTGASTKAEKLAAIEAAAEHTDPGGTEPSDENPPSGEEN